MEKVEHTPAPWIMNRRPNHRETGLVHYTVEAPEFDGPCPCGAKHPKGRLIAWLAGGLGDSLLRPEAWRHDPPTEADARLIAAAPDLLEALKWAQPAVEELHGQDIGCPSCQSAYPEGPDARCNLMDGIAAAIAKAEGR